MMIIFSICLILDSLRLFIERSQSFVLLIKRAFDSILKKPAQIKCNAFFQTLEFGLVVNDIKIFQNFLNVYRKIAISRISIPKRICSFDALEN